MKIKSGLITLIILVSISPIRFAGAAVSSPAGSNITVTTNLDLIADDGDCTLREAVQAANLNQSYNGCPAGSGADTILVPIGTYPLSIQGRGEDQGLIGDLDISETLTIRGDGIGSTTIDGLTNDRIFHVLHQDTRVTIEGMTLMNGAVPEEDLLGGGAILSWGDLILIKVELVDNSASRGGGVRNSLGSLLMSGSQVHLNHSNFEGGGIYGDGEIFVTDSQIYENTSEFGAGISADDDLELKRVTLHANVAANSGGGVYANSTTILDQVTLSSNLAIYGAGLYNNNDAALTNTTLSDNIASNSDPLGTAHGGGVYNNGTIVIQNNTLSDNQAGRGGGIYNSDLGEASLVNSILADNAGGNCANFGELISRGYNIEDSNACKFDQPGDRPYTNPMLAPLDNELGGTKTHALMVTSPAIDTANNEYCPFVDQRGVIRPVDGDRSGNPGCDIGAHENTPGGVFFFSPLERTLAETAGSQSVAVSRTGGDGVVGVSYGPGAGTAVNVADFELTPGKLSWTSGNHSSKNISFVIVDDLYVEPDEYGLIHLSNATNGAGILVPGYLFRFTILANDPGGPPQPYGPVFLPLIMK